MLFNVVWQASFLLVRHLVPIGFDRGIEHLFQKSKNGLFLKFPFHFELRWDPGILRGFLKSPGLANRGFYEVLGGCTPYFGRADRVCRMIV